jgi:hypothetical protein
MESDSPPPPLPRSYDDATVFELEPLHDPFIAREMEKRRLSKPQEQEWYARIAKDVQGNERAVRTSFFFCPPSYYSTQHFYFLFFKKTDAVIRWLKAISLSTERNFCNFAPPLSDKSFQLFVRFFWLIKVADRLKANQLLADARRDWGLEPRFHEYYFNRCLEPGDDTGFAAFAALATSTWTRHPTGQALRSTGKGVSRISVL